jgi:predicted GH43/DUF377 family glycosyl hydrolase
MKNISKPNNYWTKERCIEDAKKYERSGDWKLKSASAYRTALKKCWFDECRKHMKVIVKPKNYWTKERCIEDAKKYERSGDWKLKSESAYQKALKKGWIDECRKHMKNISKPNNYWTKERCIEDAKKYERSGDWKLKSTSAYQKALKKGWIDECRKHMK